MPVLHLNAYQQSIARMLSVQGGFLNEWFLSTTCCVAKELSWLGILRSEIRTRWPKKDERVCRIAFSQFAFVIVHPESYSYSSPDAGQTWLFDLTSTGRANGGTARCVFSLFRRCVLGVFVRLDKRSNRKGLFPCNWELLSLQPASLVLLGSVTSLPVLLMRL